jgi:riboflavin biosynthesis pyrimidine reductase
MTDWAARFARFADRKLKAATAARLAPYITEVDRPAPGSIAIGNEWTRALFDGAFHLSAPPAADLPAASLVFVQSRDGNTGANNPADLGGGATDTHVIYEGLSRVAADAVLTGAATVRGGGDILFSTWHPEIVRLRRDLGLPRHPIQIVATLRGLPFDALLYNVPDVPVVILTLPACAREMAAGLSARPWITPILMRDAHDLRAAFIALRARGIARVSVVGGRTVARALVDAGLITELFLTTSPREGGDPNTPIFDRPVPTRLAVRKQGTGEETGVRFEQLMLT